MQTKTAAFGPWLKARRKELDLTRAGLASQMGYAAVTLEKIERDLRRPSKQVAEALAQALSIPEYARAEFIQRARAGEAPLPDGEAPRPKASPPATNLPTPLTSFIDRVSELADVRGRLLKPDVRLLTLVGPPGVGKTRLSIQTGQAVLDHFADGVWFIGLAPISAPALVLPAIARAFDIAEAGPVPLIERLQTHLRSRETLLIVDNFEQVVEAAPHVADVLKACPRLKVLATSRVPLRVHGEHEFSMPALSLPPKGARLSPQQLEGFDAIKLFVTRVQAFQPDFGLSRDNAPLVMDICTRMDGMPLAIELAASRLRRFTLQQLRDALYAAPLETLTANARDIAPRQRTLRGAIQWSYDLLNPAERVAFNRLGVFVGGASTEAALAVCELQDDTILFDLTDQNLLKREGESRWMMLEMIREFALDALARSPGDESERARMRHAAYFAHRFAAQPEDQGGASFCQSMDVERHNIRAALRWLLDHKIPLAGVLSVSMSIYCEFSGLLFEGSRWLKEVLDAGLALTPRIEDEVLSWAATLSWQQSNFELGLGYANQSLARWRAAKESSQIANQLILIGRIYIEMDDCAQAQVALNEALKIGRGTGDAVTTAGVLAQLGEVALTLGDMAKAEDCFGEAYELFQALGWRYTFWRHHVWAGLVCNGLGETALIRREYDRALAFLHEGVTHTVYSVPKLKILASLAGVIGTMPRRTTDGVQRAAKIWGASEVLRNKMGRQLAPGTRRRVDMLITEARSRINAKTFAAAWAEGRELSLDEAIALAMMD